MQQIELISLIVFSAEYLLRIWTADLLYPGCGYFRALVKYIFSPMALIDLLAILPVYLPMFLPMNLMHDFARARIYANGEYRPLVKEQRLIVAPGVQRIEPDFILSPTEVALLLLLLSIGIALYEWKRKKTMKWWDVTLMTIQSLAGIVLTVMIFSQHPTTSVNLNILLFNPLPLVFIPAIIKGKRRKWGWVLLTMLMLFAIAGVFQSYAEGISIVALCLLIRAIANLKIKE